jgi:hypothetical protein
LIASFWYLKLYGQNKDVFSDARSVCEIKKEADMSLQKNDFLKRILSTVSVDKFFSFDCQKDI